MSVFPRTPLPGTVWPPRALRDPGKPRVVIGQLSGLLPCCPPAPCAQPGLSRGGGRPGALSAASRLRAPPVFTAGVTGPPLTTRSAPSPTAGSPPQRVPRSAVCVDGAGARVTTGGKPGRARLPPLGGEMGGCPLGTVPDTGGRGSGRGGSLNPPPPIFSSSSVHRSLCDWPNHVISSRGRGLVRSPLILSFSSVT